MMFQRELRYFCLKSVLGNSSKSKKSIDYLNIRNVISRLMFMWFCDLHNFIHIDRYTFTYRLRPNVYFKAYLIIGNSRFNQVTRVSTVLSLILEKTIFTAEFHLKEKLLLDDPLPLFCICWVAEENSQTQQSTIEYWLKTSRRESNNVQQAWLDDICHSTSHEMISMMMMTISMMIINSHN